MAMKKVLTFEGNYQMVKSPTGVAGEHHYRPTCLNKPSCINTICTRVIARIPTSY